VNTPIPQRLRDAAAALTGERVALAHMADAHGPAVQGTLLVLLAAPCVLPVAGVGTVLGIGIALTALQLWRGQACELLSGRVARLEMPLPWARRVLTLLAGFYGLAERHTRQRLTALTLTPPRSWLALIVATMALLIVLPIPFGNVLPAASLILLGLGLVFRDGLAVLLGVGMAVLALLFTLALVLLAWHWGLDALLDLLPG
jgi:hypothetical protein